MESVRIIVKMIAHKIYMYCSEKAYERAKVNERLHGRVVKKAGQ